MNIVCRLANLFVQNIVAHVTSVLLVVTSSCIAFRRDQMLTDLAFRQPLPLGLELRYARTSPGE